MRLIITAVLALASACVVYSNPCGAGLTDCGGYCADLRADERDCGACGAPCAVGDYCEQGVCIVGTCIADGYSCGYDSDCCSNFCASDGLCGCIPGGSGGCGADIDCCSNYCGRDGYCR